MMTDHAEARCDDHSSPFECADSLIYCDEQSGQYGLIIHDGGSSFIAIDHCPWCGGRLSAPAQAD